MITFLSNVRNIQSLLLNRLVSQPQPKEVSSDMRLHIQAAKKHKRMFRTMNCKLKVSPPHGKLTLQHSLRPLIKRENQGKSMELGHLMEIFHQTVTFLLVIVCLLCFLGHTVLISICNFNLRKHFNSFQRETHLSCFAIGNWRLFEDGSSRIISFSPPGVPCMISVGLFWEICQCFMLPTIIVRFLCSYKLS